MPTWLGIDLGKKNVKVALVRSSYRKLALEGLASAAIEESGGSIEAIRSAVSQVTGGKGGGDAMAVAVEGERVAVRLMAVPHNVQKQLGDVLGFELESQVPFEMDEAVFDYRVLPKTKRGENPDTVSVLCGVGLAADVRARIALIKEAVGHEPERVGVGGFPLGNLAPYTQALGEVSPALILDLGYLSSDVLIIENGESVFARTLSYGTHGLPQNLTALAREIRLSIGAYRSGGGVSPAQGFLCGGGAFVASAASFLTNDLGLPVGYLPPPQLDTTVLGDDRAAEFPLYAKAVGLALSLNPKSPGLNLRRGAMTYERGFGWLKEKVPVLAGLGAVLAVSFLFSSMAKLYVASHDLETARSALSAVSKEILGEEVTTAESATELINQKSSINDEDPMPRIDGFDIMVKLSEAIPASIVHDIEELDIQKNHVVVQGVVKSIADAQQIATNLRNEKCFSDVKIPRTNQVVGKDDQKYMLEFDIRCPEEGKAPKKKDPTAGGAAAAPSAAGGK